ncbi:MAG: hypothetical protein H6618_06760 [Deltaproteobacteria bacterium]|nr:hypothetical protein [Deltaproteobacteria bacterium]
MFKKFNTKIWVEPSREDNDANLAKKILSQLTQDKENDANNAKTANRYPSSRISMEGSCSTQDSTGDTYKKFDDAIDHAFVEIRNLPQGIASFANEHHPRFFTLECQLAEEAEEAYRNLDSDKFYGLLENWLSLYRKLNGLYRSFLDESKKSTPKKEAASG